MTDHGPGLSRDELKQLVRTVPDFPSSGIQFRDITTLLAHGEGLSASVDMLAEKAADLGATKVAGIEARGFIFGTALADYELTTVKVARMAAIIAANRAFAHEVAGLIAAGDGQLEASEV